VIDDHCIKCRRITNHSIVSIVDAKAAKVRCRTCYHDHDYRFEQAPPSKKDLKKAELFKEVLSTVAPGAETEDVPAVDEPPIAEVAMAVEEAPVVEAAPVAKVAPAAPAKKAKGRTKKA
jgi:hypothetical protein